MPVTSCSSIHTKTHFAGHVIITTIISSGEFPENMKLAIVKPLYKGKSKLEMNNYRPISLLPVLSKILEKIVHHRLAKFLIKRGVKILVYNYSSLVYFFLYIGASQ